MIRLDEYFYKEIDLFAIAKGDPELRPEFGIMFGEDEQGVLIWFEDKEELQDFLAQIEKLINPNIGNDE